MIPVMCIGSTTKPLYGPVGAVYSVTPRTVLVEGRPVATVGDLVKPHGNPYNPKRPGFNPPCATAFVDEGIANILVEGSPVAHLGSICSCLLHQVDLIPAKRTMVSPTVGA